MRWGKERAKAESMLQVSFALVCFVQVSDTKSQRAGSPETGVAPPWSEASGK